MLRRPRARKSSGGGPVSPRTLWERSTRRISAPISESIIDAKGPGPMPAISRIFTPLRGPIVFLPLRFCGFRFYGQRVRPGVSPRIPTRLDWASDVSGYRMHDGSGHVCPCHASGPWDRENSSSTASSSRALSQASAHSSTGSESATIPPPE